MKNKMFKIKLFIVSVFFMLGANMVSNGINLYHSPNNYDSKNEINFEKNKVFNNKIFGDSLIKNDSTNILLAKILNSKIFSRFDKASADPEKEAKLIKIIAIISLISFISLVLLLIINAFLALLFGMYLFLITFVLLAPILILFSFGGSTYVFLKSIFLQNHFSDTLSLKAKNNLKTAFKISLIVELTYLLICFGIMFFAYFL